MSNNENECSCTCNFCLTGVHCHLDNCQHEVKDDQLWQDEMLAACFPPDESPGDN